MSLTDASMRKELYFYIPGGRLDDVYSILNVTYWREEEGRGARLTMHG